MFPFRCATNPWWPILYLFRWSLSILTCCCSSNSQQLLQQSRWSYSLICPPFISSLTCTLHKGSNVEFWTNVEYCTTEAYTLAHLYICTLIQTYTIFSFGSCFLLKCHLKFLMSLYFADQVRVRMVLLISKCIFSWMQKFSHIQTNSQMLISHFFSLITK